MDRHRIFRIAQKYAAHFNHAVLYISSFGFHALQYSSAIALRLKIIAIVRYREKNVSALLCVKRYDLTLKNNKTFWWHKNLFETHMILCLYGD